MIRTAGFVERHFYNVECKNVQRDDPVKYFGNIYGISFTHTGGREEPLPEVWSG